MTNKMAANKEDEHSRVSRKNIKEFRGNHSQLLYCWDVKKIPKKSKRNVLVGAETCNINKDSITLFLGIFLEILENPRAATSQSYKKVDGMENTKAAT